MSFGTEHVLPLLCVQTLGVVSLVLATLRRETFSLVSAGVFAPSTTLWIANPSVQIHEFASILSGGAVLCASVLLTAGKRRRLASLKMLVGVLTQASSCDYRTLPEQWYSMFGELAPTDAMLYSVFFVVPCMVAAVRSRVRQSRMAAAVHSLLTVATIVVRFHTQIDSTLGVPLLGRTTYVGLTWCGLVLAFDSREE